MNAIEVRDVTKVYRRYQRRRFATLKSALLSRSLIRDLRPSDTLQALKSVSFDVAAGRSYGVIGRNGSGKSTLLKLIAGIGKPTTGTIRVSGRVSALIELGAGFHPEITGRENVFINGMMLGLTRRELTDHFDDIVAFAELEDFIDAPVKTYSSGMYVRLGFAVAIHVDPAILLVDEVLAVGDEGFTHKCLDKFAELRRRGKTILLVTHSLDLVERFCEEALWLDAGVVRAQGDPRRVIDAYRMDVAREENVLLTESSHVEQAPPPAHGAEAAPPDSQAEDMPDMFRALEGRWGSREVEITDVELFDSEGQPSHVLASGDRMEIRYKVQAARPTTDVVFGVGLFNADGVCCYGTNTGVDGAAASELSGSAEVRFVIESLDLVAGTYKLDVAVHRGNGAPYDYHRLLYTFRVTSRSNDVGIFRPRHRWQFSGGIHMSGLE